MIFKLNDTIFFYENNFSVINDYYMSIVDIIKNIIINNSNLKLNISLCNNYIFDNQNKTIRININYEHTLVKNGGRSVSINTPFGNVNDNNGNKYLVRIDNFNELNNSDIIIDYSNPNIFNVKTCSLYNSFSEKHIYISPSIYNLYFIKENRNITTLTTFINTLEPRRHDLLNQIKQQNIPHTNVNNCFNKNDLENLYKNTKIIINIHQTPHHNSFEELRALPALECGVIVISEDSPLKELIPYNDYIIWSSYENILEKVKEVINNYDYYHNYIFKSKKNKTLSEISNENYITLNNKINSII